MTDAQVADIVRQVTKGVSGNLSDIVLSHVKGFAPTNLVPRVEALEAGGGGEETDPVFGAWKGGTSIHIGQNASADGDGCILIGSGTWSAEPNAIAIGDGAIANGPACVSVGEKALTTSSNAAAFISGKRHRPAPMSGPSGSSRAMLP